MAPVSVAVIVAVQPLPLAREPGARTAQVPTVAPNVITASGLRHILDASFNASPP